MRLERGLRWGALGLLSGTLSTLLMFIPHWLHFEDALETNIELGPFRLFVAPVSVMPGLAFGIVIGAALGRVQLAGRWQIPTYVFAAMLSHFLAVQLTVNVLVDLMGSSVAVGVVAGAFGAALLAAASAAIMPAFRRGQTMTAMILAGAVLGAALFFPLLMGNFPGWLLLFGTWQAGYAASMATTWQE